MTLQRHAQKLREDCGGRVTAAEKLHLTLVFIGNVALAQLPELKSAADAIAATAFDLVLDQFGYWKHNRIVWAAPRAVPEPLRVLVAGLESALMRAEFAFDARPYAPHITLIRNAREPSALPALVLPWPVSEYTLVESVRDDRGSHYRVIGRWPLS